jgi:hypothetical protein
MHKLLKIKNKEKTLKEAGLGRMGLITWRGRKLRISEGNTS